MHIIGALDALSESILSFVKNGETIGFVPTMGALHEGHMALVKESIKQNDVTVVSIFVNPLQFNNSQDLEKYPRALEEDIELLAKYEVNVVFTPSVEEFYASEPLISINFGTLDKVLEGEYRSGHFEGVGVVVSRLLHLVRPDNAYFGLKDLQQFILIRRMCSDLGFPCNVVGVDTVRESSGLAMSSRNRLLTEKGRGDASVIYTGLRLLRDGIVGGKPIKTMIEKTQSLYDEVGNFELEYIEAINPHDFSKVDKYEDLDELAICVAGYVEGVRLIDNLYLRLK
ncbi:pantoate--beta-alanine ligase [Ekhidna sp. To15]|uniref:pantoate--beta-alanine ligase n=1 Tax=Ekhidna sp. To15 TaxID=3395267 RepID=UPI003F522A67